MKSSTNINIKFTPQGSSTIRIRPSRSSRQRSHSRTSTYIPPYTEEDQIHAEMTSHINACVMAHTPMTEALRKVGLST